LVTGKSNKGVENSAMRNSWAFAEPDEDGYCQCNFWAPVLDPGVARGLKHPPDMFVGNPSVEDVCVQPDAKLGEIDLLDSPQQSSAPPRAAGKKRARSDKPPAQEPTRKTRASGAKRVNELVYSKKRNAGKGGWNPNSMRKLDEIDDTTQRVTRSTAARKAKK